MHLNESILHAYLDNELAGPEQSSASEHLRQCGECSDHLASMRKSADRVGELLSAVVFPAPFGPRKPNTRRGLRKNHLALCAGPNLTNREPQFPEASEQLRIFIDYYSYWPESPGFLLKSSVNGGSVTKTSLSTTGAELVGEPVEPAPSSGMPPGP